MTELEKNTIIQTVCIFRYCGDWNCPYKGVDCSAFISDAGVIRGFVQACKHEPGFLEHAMKRCPNVTRKFYCGVQYG